MPTLSLAVASTDKLGNATSSKTQSSSIFERTHQISAASKNAVVRVKIVPKSLSTIEREKSNPKQGGSKKSEDDDKEQTSISDQVSCFVLICTQCCRCHMIHVYVYLIVLPRLQGIADIYTQSLRAAGI